MFFYIYVLIQSVFLFSCLQAKAYPDFIGYGYTSCLTCHYNGQGGGPLSDYGRALFSELTARTFVSERALDEDLAEESGFLGKRKLPYWIRPSLKLRTLWLQKNPGAQDTTEKIIPMQLDVGSNFFFSEEMESMIQVVFSKLSDSEALRRGTGAFQPKEYFFRSQIGDGWWYYIGLMDRVFGIRNVDHTSYQRSPNGLTQFAQSHGLIIHKINEKWELTWNAFFGNATVPNQDQEQKGFSIMGEMDLAEKMRAGSSFMTSRSEINRKNSYAVHYKQGLDRGTSLLAEYGILQTAFNDDITATNGSYTFLQAQMLLSRGYHFCTTVERYNSDVSSTKPDQWRYGVGFLTFPFTKTEFRFDLSHYRAISETSVDPDQIYLQGQLHVAF